jgi:hypothetical protein
MGRILVAARADLGSEQFDDIEPVGRVYFGGVYFFLYDEIKELQASTGQLIDPQKDAFFDGEQLVELERWLAANFERAVCQSSEWEQRVGTQSNGEVLYERTSRDNVIAFLRNVARAARMAHERNEGVLFCGE